MTDPRVWDEGVGRYTAPGLPPDDPVEVGRYLDAFKRSRRLIAAIVVLFTAAVFVISLLLPKTYQATSKLVLNPIRPVPGDLGPAVDPARPGDRARVC